MRKKLFITVLACIVGYTVYAQSAFVVTGGDIHNPNGTVNYSIGQVFFATDENSQLSLSAGLQSPYEVIEDISTGIEDLGIKLLVRTYPNPVKSILTLETPENLLDSHDWHYLLYNINGSIVSLGNISSVKTEIDMQRLSTSTYFLKILKGNDLLKSFIIIKN